MSKREIQIVELVHKYGELSVQELSDLLDTSPSSIRRDLIALNNHRFVRRNHGGVELATVINYEQLGVHHIPVDKKEARAIAQTAAGLIHPGDIIGLSGGELCTQLALLTRLIENITVVTNAVNIAAELVDLTSNQVRLTGGRLNRGSFELVGQSLEPSLEGIHIHKFFLGTDGLSPEIGVTGHDEAESTAARVMMSHSDATIVLADSRKFNKASFAQVAPITAFQTIITTDLVPKPVLAQFEQAGVNVMIASNL